LRARILDIAGNCGDFLNTYFAALSKEGGDIYSNGDIAAIYGRITDSTAFCNR
jgi:hypothetical protein